MTRDCFLGPKIGTIKNKRSRGKIKNRVNKHEKENRVVFDDKEQNMPLMKIATMQANEGNRFYWHQLDKLQYKSLDLL